MTTAPEAIRAALLNMACKRGPGKTFCPSEVARALALDWRALMPAVRVEAAHLVAENRLVATQSGHPVCPETARGPIRLGQPAHPPHSS